ncbi:MAG: S8 family peptidase [Casimicrobiaceae bacterium]
MPMLCQRPEPRYALVRHLATFLHQSCRALPVLGTAIALTALPVFAEPVDALLVMPAPSAVSGPEGLPGLIGRLEARAGTKLILTGTTRTGALALALPPTEFAVIATRLRDDRAVLWVDRAPAPGAVQKARSKAGVLGEPGQKLMVRLNADVAADWTVLAPRFAAVLGIAVIPERQIGNVWVLRLAASQPAAVLAELAARLQMDSAVQYADPVLRRYAQTLPPDDPYYPQQWNLTDSVSGIDLAAAWALQRDTAPITVAVVDTGILPHPDLAGRVLPGYDFISDPQRARDGDGRDPDPRDEGDWLGAGDCGGYPAEPSSWHGTFVAGLIAANTNNGIGIAGVNANARIVPVRALGQCGGTDEDVFAALLWAAGAPVTGVPPNANPAKVINLSLGGFGACAQSIQEAVNDAIAHGAIVVAAAGNESDDVASFAPANCSGIITVAAHNRAGARASYSNFGRRIDISAPSGDGGGSDSTVSLSNDGSTLPGAAIYDEGIGTSFSAPLVAGTVSMMLGRNPILTTGRVLAILQGTTRSFPDATACRLGGFCGVGMLDSGLAMASTIPATDAAPEGTVAVVEYYNAALDHYFMTANAAEIAALDAPWSAFVRTGFVFYAYPDVAHAPPGTAPVCRFYADASVQIDAHYFTADAAQCAFVQQRWPGVWQLENAAAFYVVTLDAAGQCPDTTVPVYRFFNGRRDASQRFSIDLSVGRTMVNRAWVRDGPGPNGAVFCSPI